MKRIDTEAHFFTPSYAQEMRERSAPPRTEVTADGVRLWDEPSLPDFEHLRSHRVEEALCEIGEARLALMDQAGIDVQVLSLSTPGCEQLEQENGSRVAATSNDELAAVIEKHPDRFVGLAALAPSVDQPDIAVDELVRTVNELGFRGAKVNSHIHDTYLDDDRYSPLWEAMSDLGVPLYLHPTIPHRSMAIPYMGLGFALLGPSLGFGAETALSATRMIAAGVFERFPNLKVILGHLGEGLPFWLYRLDFISTRRFMDIGHDHLEKLPSEYLRENFIFTTSGNFRSGPTQLVLDEFGFDHLMLASDYPYESMSDATGFVDSLDLNPDEARQLNSGTAEAVFGL